MTFPEMCGMYAAQAHSLAAWVMRSPQLGDRNDVERAVALATCTYDPTWGIATLKFIDDSRVQVVSTWDEWRVIKEPTE